MTIRTMREWLAALEAAGVSLDEEILVDAVSEEEGTTFRCDLTGAAMEHAHDEDETPYGVLLATDISDEPADLAPGATPTKESK